MAKVKCLVVLGFADGSFESISEPNRLMGYRPNRIWFFGNPKDEKDKILFEASLRISSGVGIVLDQLY